MIKSDTIGDLFTYRTLPIPFGYLFLSGLLIALLLTLQEYLSYLIASYQYDFSWFSISSAKAINFGLLILMAPLASGYARYLSQKGKHIRLVVLLFLVSLTVALVHRGLSTIVYNAVYSVYSGGTFVGITGYWSLQSFGAGIISSLIYYWVLIGLFIAVISQKNLIKREKELTNARLDALVTQLRPHFLFNTLNSVSSLIDIDKTGAQKMIARFGDLLRAVLDKETKQFIPLHEEMTFIENYLSIESERFSDRMSVEYKLEPGSLNESVPTLILQPLVENAIKHGIAKKVSHGKIEITSQILNGAEHAVPQLKLTVHDNGTGPLEGFTYSVGLKNVSSRLSELYGDKAFFQIYGDEQRGCVAIVTLPINRN